MNNFSAEEYNLKLFNAKRFYWHGGSIDRAAKHGIYLDNQTGGDTFFDDVTIGYSGRATNNTYFDLNILATNTGNVFTKG